MKISLAVLAIATITACNRNGRSLASEAMITIRAPDHLLAAIPTGRTACFAINVQGAGITSQKVNSCSPTTGTLAGFLPAGQDLAATVPSNSSINIDLYLYLMPTGSTAACPSLPAAFTPGLMHNMYLIGSANNVATGQSVTTVDITADFPSTNQNIVAQLGLPAACGASSTPPSPFAMSAGGVKELTGTGIKMNARAGESYGAKTLTGTGVKLLVR